MVESSPTACLNTHASINQGIDVSAATCVSAHVHNQRVFIHPLVPRATSSFCCCFFVSSTKLVYFIKLFIFVSLPTCSHFLSSPASCFSRFFFGGNCELPEFKAHISLRNLVMSDHDFPTVLYRQPNLKLRTHLKHLY